MFSCKVHNIVIAWIGRSITDFSPLEIILGGTSAIFANQLLFSLMRIFIYRSRKVKTLNFIAFKKLCATYYNSEKHIFSSDIDKIKQRWSYLINLLDE